jgi:multiple sugar transport system substrate-binding protein
MNFSLRLLPFVLFAVLPLGAQPPKLSIAWFEWQPCQALKTLAATYRDASVSVQCAPIGDWHESIFSAFSEKKGADLVILDSQWIGEAVKGKHIQEVTQWMRTNLPLDDYLPAALSAYGEYPQGSGRMYGVPAQADTQVLIYRKDLLAAARFQPPATWSELLRQARFFKANQRAGAADGFVTHWCAAPSCYDQVQTTWNQIAWSFGGELWDPLQYRILGVLDSPANVAALELARQLVRTGPDNAANYEFHDVVEAMCTGKSAMAAIWFGFAGEFGDSRACPQSANLGYAMIPGESRHFVSLGGMGISVSAYTANSAAALQFLKWFQADAQQLAWAKAGGAPARRSILASEAFTRATPYNPVFTASYDLVKDFWNVPEYNQLLPIQGALLNLALTGKAEPRATLGAMAVLQQQVLDLAYPMGSPFVPAIAPGGIVNGASFLTGAVAPGEVVSIFGTAIGPGIPTRYRPGGLLVPTELNGTRVFFDGLAAPILFTSAGQITAVVPYGVAGKSRTSITVSASGKTTAAVTAEVRDAAPAIFTADQSGAGQILAINQNGDRNGVGARAGKGTLVTIFITGAGVTAPATFDGVVSGDAAIPPALPVSLTIGGVAAEAVTTVASPGMVSGILAIQARVPAGAGSGDAVPVVLSVGTATSTQVVTMAVQ